MDLQNTVQTALDKMYENTVVNKQGKAISINVKGHEFTLVDDGTMQEGKLAYLDIADGNIDLYSNGYKQYTGNLQYLNKNGATEYTGKYILTGTTTENVVRVCDEGTFDITIKDLNIDVSEKNNTCAFNANCASKAESCFVNITIDGNNFLQGGNNAPGLGFANAMPNINGVTNGSTLTIQGNGSIEAIGGGFSAGIGSGYTGAHASVGQVSNIIINSGNINASGHIGIGGARYANVNNKIINGGNIEAKSTGLPSGIGSTSGNGDNIIINGGNIIAIGGGYGSSINSENGKTQINGGNIICSITTDAFASRAVLGGSCRELVINGGTIKVIPTNRNSNYAKYAGISCAEGGNIKIIGGNILGKGQDYDISTYSGSSLVPYTPTDGTNNLYETPIKLDGVAEGKKITKLTTSDNIEYGIKDMYTLENGMLYLYLPTGTRTITITTEDGKTYSETVETKETPEEIVLNEIN